MEQRVRRVAEAEHLIELHIQHMMEVDVAEMMYQVEEVLVIHNHAVEMQQQVMELGVVGERVQKHVEQEHKQEQEHIQQHQI